MKLSIAAAIGLLALSVSEAVKVNPLPKPTEITWGNTGTIRVDDGFNFRWAGAGQAPKVLSDAFARTRNIIRKEKWFPQSWEQPMPEWPEFPKGDKQKRADDDYGNGGTGYLLTVDVHVADVNADLQHGVDESYTLDVTADGKASIKANTVWGALHGLSTFEQIVIYVQGNDPRFLIEQPVSIKDSPKYIHRGVMYDTARNFLPIATLKKQIEALSFAKLNVLHWHLTDSQSWPIEIKKHPKFREGSYSAREWYTQAEVADLIQFGRAHGVRIIPEIDMPAHSNKGWAAVDPQTITCGDSWWSNDNWPEHSAVQPNPGHLDIAYPGVYPILTDLYNELATLFTDKVFHVGFDELMPNCYNFSKYSMDWIHADPKRTFNDLAQLWVNKTLPIFYREENGVATKRPMMWEDSVLQANMHADIPKDVIMQSWNNGVKNIKALANKGYDVVVTSADFFYLDCGHGGYVTNDPRYNEQELIPLPKNFSHLPQELEWLNGNLSNSKGNLISYSLTTLNFGGPGASWCSPYKSWQRIYNYDFTRGLTDEEATKVIGGEAAMWSETTDATNLDNKVWPRAAALSELLWSGNRDSNGLKRTTELSTRLFEFRERLVNRGINASPLVPKFCIQNPHHCDLNKNQDALHKSDAAWDDFTKNGLPEPKEKPKKKPEEK
ncbi:hypothetical protein BGW41_007138 [Actinomortierella wolfii]|nr:hypothetical protein BGW41_007138 [Actinomortierella wolfii]